MQIACVAFKGAADARRGQRGRAEGAEEALRGAPAQGEEPPLTRAFSLRRLRQRLGARLEARSRGVGSARPRRADSPTRTGTPPDADKAAAPWSARRHVRHGSRSPSFAAVLTTSRFTVNLLMYPRDLRVPERSFFLFGPRGTGKTTWLRSLLRDATGWICWPATSSASRATRTGSPPR